MILPIVVLNWNNGKDTIECLSSIIQLKDAPRGQLILCDNHSTDDSINKIEEWADSNDIIIEHVNYQRKNRSFEFRDASKARTPRPGSVMTLIHTGGNMGYAAGNNAGILFAMTHLKFEYLLLLNNDTVVTDETVSAMVGRMSQDPMLGMCGCKVAYYKTPKIVQAWGGATFAPWIGRARHLGAGESSEVSPDRRLVEKKMDYVLGVALMVSQRLLKDVGLMDERYFIYYEEIDWAIRAKKKSFHLGYAQEAVVYHKEGGTIGSSRDKRKRSLLSEHYQISSRLLFTRKNFPWFFLSVWGFSAFQTLRALMRLDFTRFNVMARALAGLKFTEIQSL